MRTYCEPTGSALMTWLSTTNLRIRRRRSLRLGRSMGFGRFGTRLGKVLILSERYQPGVEGVKPLGSVRAKSSLARSCARKSPRSLGRKRPGGESRTASPAAAHALHAAISDPEKRERW